ncbi:MAG TPA: hypothetical protein VED01_24240 [Burkholderiales bacterium]|nr:hypothetical protein [Burkholderiales bacterium]
MQKLDVVSPAGVAVVERTALAPRLTTLDGKTIGEVWNGDFKGDVTFPLIRDALARRYPRLKIVRYTEFPHHHGSDDPAKQRERARSIATSAKAKGCDALISGNGA